MYVKFDLEAFVQHLDEQEQKDFYDWVSTEDAVIKNVVDQVLLGMTDMNSCGSDSGPLGAARKAIRAYATDAVCAQAEAADVRYELAERGRREAREKQVEYMLRIQELQDDIRNLRSFQERLNAEHLELHQTNEELREASDRASSRASKAEEDASHSHKRAEALEANRRG